MVVRFHVVSPVAKKRTFTVRLPILLGRGEEAKFRIQHDLVSRKHCEFFERQGQVYVRDLGSTNGTFLDDEQVPASTKTVVPPGGIVRVGGLSFAVEYQLPTTADATSIAEGDSPADGPGLEESRVEGGDASSPDEQPDFQVVHEDEEQASAEPPVDKSPVDEPPVDEPPVDEPPVDEPQWPVADAAAAEVPDDDQLNSFFKGLK